MKEEILYQITTASSTLNKTIYPLMEEHNCYSFDKLYFEVLEFMCWVKKKHADVYEENELEYHFDVLLSFGYGYLKTFEPFWMPSTVDDDGVLPIGLPINDMINGFYEYIIELDSDNASLQAIQAGFDIEEVVRVSDGIKYLTRLVNNQSMQLAEIHSAQFARRIVADTNKLSLVEIRKQKKKEKEDKIQQMRNRAHEKILNQE